MDPIESLLSISLYDKPRIAFFPCHRHSDDDRWVKPGNNVIAGAAIGYSKLRYADIALADFTYRMAFYFDILYLKSVWDGNF